MVKKANMVEKEPENLKWSWMRENLTPFMTDEKGSYRKNELLEQIVTSTDQSDYLWYRTRYWPKKHFYCNFYMIRSIFNVNLLLNNMLPNFDT